MVRNFLMQINALELAAAKKLMKATTHLLNIFHEAANFLVLSVTPLKTAQ